MGMTNKRAKHAWKLAVSLAALSFGAGIGSASADPNAPDGMTITPQIVPNDNLDPFAPPPAGVLDQGVTGIGQMVTDIGGGFVGLCTGTLINPRTVIFAAHCVNSASASAYSAGQGGIPISFGFSADNLDPAITWLSNGNQTDAAQHIFNVNQVWYDTRSLPTTFLEGDIALATLDTPATGIPTWALLFSPLTAETHATIVGYGATGTGTLGGAFGIDFRRRAAENMLSALVSLDDLDVFLFGAPPEGLPQSLYQLDFDSPGMTGDFDFDLFDGAALPGEGLTAGGDSGGPLIVDQQFDRPVVVGTLDGGITYFNGEPSSGYGTSSFYMPLFLFWDEIVANNPYVYARAKAGNGNWTDPHHWVQGMDPNYTVIRDGDLTNSLPDTPAQGITGDTVKFGSICFLDACTDLTQDGPGTNSTGAPVFVEGGPGAVNFVPDNVDPNINAGVRAHYYDVTLSAPGETYLTDTVTIDRFTENGVLTSLDVRKHGVLNVLGDFNGYRGFINIDGQVNSGEALLLQSVLTGSGTFNPTYLTSVDGVIAPGALLGVGTLRIQGDVILASENELLIELNRATADQLRILADAAQRTNGSIDLGGDLWLSPATSGGPPRAGNTYTIVLADGQVLDHFDDVNAYLGILRPEVTYGAHSVTVKLTAGRFADALHYAPGLLPFALALDELREHHYDALYDLYGQIDIMDAGHLAAAFSSFAPASGFDAHGLLSMQNRGFGLTMDSRISLLSRADQPDGFTVMGSPSQVFNYAGSDGLGLAPSLSLSSLMSGSTTLHGMPAGMTGFVQGGYHDDGASAAAGRSALTADESMRTWDMAGGVEQRFGAFTLGVAAAYSHGASAQSAMAAAAESDLSQSVVYGVYRFNNGFYASAMVGAGMTHASTERRYIAGALDYQLSGQTGGEVYQGQFEFGVNFRPTEHIYITPKIGVRDFAASIDGYTEGGGEVALQIAAQNYERREARVGVSFDGDFAFNNGWRFTPSLDAAMVLNLSGDEPGVLARFAAAPDASFFLPGAVRDASWAEISGGLQLVHDMTSFALRFESSIGREEVHDDRTVVQFSQKF